MRFTTDPMLILEYGNWDLGDGPATRKDGSIVENVALLDLDADEIHRYTLSAAVGSDRPAPMTPARIVCSAETGHRGRQDGTVASKLKVQVTGFMTADQPAAAASPRTAENGKQSRERAAA